jgi:hypothetical protein
VLEAYEAELVRRLRLVPEQVRALGDLENPTGIVSTCLETLSRVLRLRHSDIVVADLTGNNPNVYYEMGISHALGKPTVLTVFSRDGSVPAEIPFDVRIQRVVPYGTTQSLQAQLRELLPAATPLLKKREAR